MSCLLVEEVLQKVEIVDFLTTNNSHFKQIDLSYQVFGKPLHEAPIVLVNHALTGNSNVCGDNGWWNGLIGKDKCVDTERYSIISFNIPGNGYNGIEENLLADYKAFNARDIALIFGLGLQKLGIDTLYAVIGGSVGGGIAWELAALFPTLIEHLIPVATDWKSSDWLKANCLVQEQILLNSDNPIHDARLHAMLIYRSPQSLRRKFGRSYNDEQELYNVESWLLYHGDKLNERFTLSAYQELNHVVANIDITYGRGSFLEVVESIKSNIHMISVDSDMFFTLNEDIETCKEIRKVKQNVTHGIINSIHGHDAFLIEFEQLSLLLNDVF